VVSAPSGTGKTTVCRALVAADPGLRFSVSHTTRAPRPRERDGVDYWFVSRERFGELVAEGAFLEHAEYAGNLYGTSWAAMDGPLGEGVDLLLEIEVQGAAQVRARRPDARFVFLLPPSLEALEARLRGRGSDGPEVIRARLELARRELGAVELFDYAVVNDELDACVAAVREVIDAERRGDPAPARRRHGRDVVWPRLAPRLQPSARAPAFRKGTETC
jgi:guanylate kinase